MRILIVFDSFFGNTEKLARGMAEALRSKVDVGVQRASEADVQAVEDADMVIVGSPTRAFRPSEATVEFLKKLPDNSLAGKRAAAFDTRIAADGLGSALLKFIFKHAVYADKGIVKWLSKRGVKSHIPSEGFFVTMDNPPELMEGELQRATQWIIALLN